MSQLKLAFDGSHLGTFEFDKIVKSCFPLTNKTISNTNLLLRADILYDNIWYKVILKRIAITGTNIQLLEEMKHLFGLTKIGTHMIELNGIPTLINQKYDWYIDHKIPISNVCIVYKWCDYCIFNVNTIPTKINITMPLNKSHYEQMQKLILFRQCICISTNVKEDFYLLDNGNITIFNDSLIRECATYKKLSNEEELYFYPTDDIKIELLIKMLNITYKTLGCNIDNLRSDMTEIFERLCKEKLPIIKKIIDDLYNKIYLHFIIK